MQKIFKIILQKDFYYEKKKKRTINPAKNNIASELIKIYDIKTYKDIQDALEYLLKVKL